MPLIPSRETQGILGAPLPVKPVEASPDFFSEAIPAAFQLDNSITSSARKMVISGIDDSFDPSYKPLDGIEGYEEYADDFAYTDNTLQGEALKVSIDYERQQRDILRRSGGLGILASMAAGVTDPIAFVPVAGQSAKAYKAGESLLQVGFKSATAGLMSSTATETLLQDSQYTRTGIESGMNIAATTLLSGVLGAGGVATFRALTGQPIDIKTPVINDLLTIPETEPLDDLMAGGLKAVNEPDSVGAMRAWETTLEQETLKSAYGTIGATKFMTPMLRMATSPFKSARTFSQKLIENPIYFNKNVEGIATEQAVETLIKENRAGLAKAYTETREAYKEANKVANISEKDFKEQVSMAMRRNDVSENPQVQRAAQSFRKNVFEPLKKRAIENKLLPEDVTVETADSYLTRVWNRKKIIDNEPEFRTIVSDWVRKEAKGSLQAFERETAELMAKGDAALVKIEREALKRERFDVASNFDGYVDDVVDSVLAKMKGLDPSTSPYNIEMAARGPLKERTFNIPDSLVEDFLENDIEVIADRYSRIMGADVELKEKFGTVKFEDAFKEIQKEYTEAAKKAKPEELKKLNKELEKSKRDLQAMWDLVRGTYKHSDSDFAKIARVARDFNYMRMMGGVVVSSLTDVAMPVFVHGMGRYTKTVIKPLFRGLKGIKLSREEAKRAGAIVETVLNSRLASLAEIADPYARGTAVERFSQRSTQFFSKWSGIALWNDMGKTISSVITQDRIINNALKGGDKEYMAFLGLDTDTQKAIAKMFKAHGETVDGVKVAHTELWEDMTAARAYRAAINKDVDRTIISKGLGDVPLFMNTELGKTMMQFKSFAMASNQRVLISGLQRSDAAVLQGITMMVAMGMLVYYLKTIESGKEVSDDPAKWLVEGIDRSGIISVFMEVNNLAEKGGFAGLARLSGQAPASRFAARSGAETIAGPTFGTAVNMFEATNALNKAAQGEGDITKRDIHNLRKLIPFQNLIGVRHLFDRAEESIQNSVGAE